ncbi:DUF1499 domain-containing protein [Synechococcus sp. CC9616]|uniref:DUF1499 domain-containing protein n=1 Tax=Synechococcus sp. CC9616 TaxID=110663 RepID=UPI0004B99722|nr:DUF1499 domain-containing protein [Synechococcus sp. CC9616]
MAVLASLFLPLLMLFHLVGPIPADLGVHDGKLSPCPGPAHCAQRQWAMTDSGAEFRTLANAVETLPRTQIIERTEQYLHAEVSSALFGFVDDLELLDTGTGIEARSISRLGDSDLGVNANRLAGLRP